MARSGGLCPLLHLIQRRPPGSSWGSSTKRSKEGKGPEKGLGVTGSLVPEKRTGQLFSCLPECFQCPLVTISNWCVSRNVRSYDYLELPRDYPVCPAHQTPTTVLWVWHYCHPVCKGGKGNVKQCSSSTKDTQEMAEAGPETQAVSLQARPLYKHANGYEKKMPTESFLMYCYWKWQIELFHGCFRCLLCMVMCWFLQ